MSQFALDAKTTNCKTRKGFPILWIPIYVLCNWESYQIFVSGAA